MRKKPGQNVHTPDPAARHTSNVTLIRRFWPYEKKYWKIIVLDLFCALLTCLCDLVLPLILRYITNTAVSNLAALTVGVILKMAFLYLVLRLIDAVEMCIRDRPGSGVQYRDRAAFCGGQKMFEFIRTACAVHPVCVADPAANAAEICSKIDEAAEKSVDVLVFPELAVTGYTCGDLFFQKTLLDGALSCLLYTSRCV